MTDAGVANEAVLLEPGGTEEEQQCLSLHEEAATDDIPPSLIGYFETSKSRAAACEKLITEDLEAFTTPYDVMNFPIELSGDMVNLNEQGISETGRQSSSSTDSCIFPETESLVTDLNVAASPKSEDETEADEHTESVKNLFFKARIPKSSLTKGEIKEIGEYEQQHREKRKLVQKKKEEQMRERENIFEKELKKLMEFEKLHQMESELMEKRAQEKLEQELLLQQELIRNLQKQVEEERRVMAEDLKRIKEEEEKKRKAEEEKRKRVEEDRKKMEEEKRKREIQRMEEDMRRKEKEEEIRKIKEIQAEMERRHKEERRKKKEEEERRKREEERKRKEEEESKREEEDRKKMEAEEMKREIQRMEEDMRRKEEDEIRKIKEVQAETERKHKEEQRKEKEAKELRKREEEKRKEEESKREEDRKKMEEEEMKKEIKRMEEDMRRKEEEIRKVKEVLAEMERTHEEEEQKKREEERNKRNEEMRKEDELRKRQEEVGKRQEEEKNENRKIEEEIRPTEKDEDQTHEAKIRTEKERSHEQEEENLEVDGTREREGGGINAEVKDEVSENVQTQERWLRNKEESEAIRVEDNEATERLRENNNNNSTNRGTERENTGSTGPLLTSRRGDSHTWTPSDHRPSHSEAPGSSAAQQHGRQENTAETSKTTDPQAANRLREHVEQRRLTWMKQCISWSKLSLQNRRKQKGSLQSGRVPRRAAEAEGLPPLRPDTLLQSTGCGSLQEVTSVTLEDSPVRNVSTLVQCTQLRSLTLRRCGLRSLQGISHLSQLCYVDVTENEISFVDCENMSGLRVLLLSYNRLTSIHGLSGADNLDVLELSHNNITRIAGLESMRRLQRLSVDHNQLISTKGLRDVYTLLHLNCSHNHLASVEGLENSALLNTLDLRANSLSEPPGLDNHVLLRELCLDDNSISCLLGLAACWLPLMQHLSVAQNRITRLPSMSNFVSLANLDLRFNCMLELQNVCESLEGCHFLQDIHLAGNPLQQENAWRPTLQRALPGLRAIDDQETDSCESPPAVEHTSSAPVSFQTFCQAQLQQIKDLQQQHSRELSNASSSLDAMTSFCQHYSDSLKLAEKQRFAHEYGDITGSVVLTVLEKTADARTTSAKKRTGPSQPDSSETVPAVSPSRSLTGCSPRTFEQSLTDRSSHTPETDLSSPATQGNASSSRFKMAALSDHDDPDLQNAAAIVIQRQWRKYRPKCGNPAAEKKWGTGGAGGNQQSGPSCISQSVSDQHYAATVIQAFWRGFFVRRRLASALAAVTYPSTREDDTFEEVDVDEFVFDEAALEKHWTLQLSEDPLCRQDAVSEPPLSPKCLGPLPEPSYDTLPTQPARMPKQAWVCAGEEDGAGQRASPQSSHRKSTPLLGDISERSEKIMEEWGFRDSHLALMMLKRAQKMSAKQQQKKKHGDPLLCLGLFGNCIYQPVPGEAPNRPAPPSRNHMKVCRPELGPRQAERTEPAKRRPQAPSESEHFLPEMSLDILSGGRVQLVADPAYAERHGASSGSAAQPSRQNSSHARKDVPSPPPATPVPSLRERISFRDNPVHMSGGWGSGKKRSKVYKVVYARDVVALPTRSPPALSDPRGGTGCIQALTLENSHFHCTSARRLT